MPAKNIDDLLYTVHNPERGVDIFRVSPFEVVAVVAGKTTRQYNGFYKSKRLNLLSTASLVLHISLTDVEKPMITQRKKKQEEEEEEEEEDGWRRRCGPTESWYK
ncbi:hypothetical protein INR49_027271, partial [Caranx melampygus]